MRSNVMTTGAAALVLCLSSSALAAPATWAEVERVPGADALAVIGETTHVIAKLGGSWFVTTDPIGVFERPTIRRAFDASLLAKQPAIALVVESRDGGSGMGTVIDQLVILCAADAQLRNCGEITIGRLDWVLDGEHRSKYPDGAFSLRKRPHVEVVLEPTLVAPDGLRLTVKRNSTLAPPEGAWESETLAMMDTLRRSAGVYRLRDGELVRVD